MVKYRIFYFVAVIGLLLFYIFCNIYVSLLTLLLLAAITVFGFVTTFIASKKIDVSLKSIRPFSVQGADDSFGFTVNFTNKSIIPVSMVNAVLDIKDSSEDAVVRRKVRTPLSAKETKSISITLKSPHSAVVEGKLVKLRCYDLFGIFSFRIKPTADSESFVVMPCTAKGEYAKNAQGAYIPDSDIFSDTEKGDDPSQVFEVRNYVSGDDLRKVHWGLSSKYNSLMVKEFSRPVAEECIVVLESGISGCDEYNCKQLADEILSVFMKLSYELIESEQKFKVCWYSNQYDSISEFDAASLDDIPAVVKMFLSYGYSNEKSISLKAFGAAPENQTDKQIYYIYTSLYADEEILSSADMRICVIDTSKNDI